MMNSGLAIANMLIMIEAMATCWYIGQNCPSVPQNQVRFRLSSMFEERLSNLNSART